MVPIIFFIAGGKTHLNDRTEYFFVAQFFFRFRKNFNASGAFVLLIGSFGIEYSPDQRKKTMLQKKHDANDLWSSSSVCTEIRSVHHCTIRATHRMSSCALDGARLSNSSQNIYMKAVTCHCYNERIIPNENEEMKPISKGFQIVRNVFNIFRRWIFLNREYRYFCFVVLVFPVFLFCIVFVFPFDSGRNDFALFWLHLFCILHVEMSFSS